MQGVGALLLGLPLGPCKSLGIAIEPARTLRTFVFTLDGCSKHVRKDGTLIVHGSMHLAASSLLADKTCRKPVGFGPEVGLALMYNL
jgi:hypothetical protein